jgi:hypothetical protein
MVKGKIMSDFKCNRMLKYNTISWHMPVMTEVSAVSPTLSRQMKPQYNYAIKGFLHFLPIQAQQFIACHSARGWIIMGHPSYILLIHYSLAILSFDVKCSEILVVTTN